VYAIVTPHQFLRQARKFSNKHPDLNPGFAQVLNDQQSDPFQPRLELHPLGGKLAGCQAVDLTHNYRITLTLLITDREISLLDVLFSVMIIVKVPVGRLICKK
jgi:mRNA-degrading endonuclease YafQ of YafQ-DinJ toxin-antitoxin module